MNNSREAINYVVGQELSLLELLQTFDIKGLLQGALEGGATEAAILLGDGSVICSVGKSPVDTDFMEVRHQLLLEGEPAGCLLVRGGKGDRSLDGIAAMLKVTVDMVITNNLKRMLTAQMHSSLVTKTYDELLSKNLALSASEARYRELAENLEVKVTERTRELAVAQVKLLQQEKLASIGQLAAGVAHEINNPLGFINSNLVTMKKYVSRMLEMIGWLESRVEAGSPAAAEIQEKKHSLKIDIVTEDVWDLLEQSLAGAERVRKIVADLKGVSHVDETGVKSFNICHEAEQTLAVVKNLLPNDAEVNTAFSETPPVAGSGALFCQALENMIKNSVQACPQGLVLELACGYGQGMAWFSIADNGCGVSPEIRNRIFDPFFTTRDVGEGAGMGLAVVYDIVKTSAGNITVSDSPSGGALFMLEFPAVTQEEQ